MSDRAARIVTLFGAIIVALALGLLVVDSMASDKIQAVAGTLAIGIGLVVLGLVGPFLKAFKAGGMEFEFIGTANDRLNQLEKRLADLELAAKHPEGPRPASPAPPEWDLKTDRRDPQRGRFQGLASRDGMTLSGTVQHVARDFVEILLEVRAGEETGLQQAECVEFHLPTWYRPHIIPAVFKDGIAQYHLIAQRRFTVAAWIGCREKGLELDLADVAGAPRILREG